MLSGRAFRAQLVTQGQRDLYDYWHQSCRVTRACRPAPIIDPFSVPKLLPCIGLIDVTGGLEEARFRLAGTRLHDVYGEEITGKRIDQVFAGRAPTIGTGFMPGWWTQGMPLHGVVRGPAEGRDHIVLFWLRLPLSQDGTRVDRILCYDTAGPIESVCASAERFSPPIRRVSPMLDPAAPGALRLASFAGARRQARLDRHSTGQDGG